MSEGGGGGGGVGGWQFVRGGEEGAEVRETLVEREKGEEGM